MNLISKEIGIFFATFMFYYIAHKLEIYDIMIVYLLSRIWIELKDGKL